MKTVKLLLLFVVILAGQSFSASVTIVADHVASGVEWGPGHPAAFYGELGVGSDPRDFGVGAGRISSQVHFDVSTLDSLYSSINSVTIRLYQQGDFSGHGRVGGIVEAYLLTTANAGLTINGGFGTKDGSIAWAGGTNGAMVAGVDYVDNLLGSVAYDPATGVSGTIHDIVISGPTAELFINNWLEGVNAGFLLMADAPGSTEDNRMVFNSGTVAGYPGPELIVDYTPIDDTERQFYISPKWGNILLPGSKEFIFTNAGRWNVWNTDPSLLIEMANILEIYELGNGFEPSCVPILQNTAAFETLVSIGWPSVLYPVFSDHQVKEGRERLTDDGESLIQMLDDSNIFSGMQFAEWGYFFHNLSWNEGHFMAMYGDEYPNYSHLLQPVGYDGYDQQMSDKLSCYEAVKNYFTRRNKYQRGRNISMTGHSNYEPYVPVWGGKIIGMELGENIAFTQTKVAMARGASRQWGIPWSMQILPWFSNSFTTVGALYQRADGVWNGLDAGHSLSFYQRMWQYGWFSGAAYVSPENTIANSWFESYEPVVLTPHGQKGQEFFRFIQDPEHDCGVPFTPVALVIDFHAGYNGYMGKAWGTLPFTSGDRQIDDLFTDQIFPQSDHIKETPFPDNPEQSYLRSTPFGEVFDILLSNADGAVMQCYSDVILAGDIEFTDLFVTELAKILQKGTRVFINSDQKLSLGEDYDRLNGTGNLLVMGGWTNPFNGRIAAVPHSILNMLSETRLPVKVNGDPIQYLINRNSRGWVLALINNEGITKFPDQPAQVDSLKTAEVEIEPFINYENVQRWALGQSDQELESTNGLIHVSVAPGEVVYIEFITGEYIWPANPDTNRDGVVNFIDLSIIAENWLRNTP